MDNAIGVGEIQRFNAHEQQDDITLILAKLPL
jgi:hypothetical protein